ncbi:TetR/AcrR family transcriptional regulator [Gordonia sp. X0973]|nr:TetR/AcrR family transcriptional regulator [Gordonia sp. X0973]
MSPAQRRETLLDVGARVFAQRSVEDVSMEDVAVEAGVTRRLLYHYFPTKAEFFGAIWHRAHAAIAASVAPRPPASVRDGIDQALAAFFDFYEANIPLVIVANRSSISADPAVRGPIDRDFAVLCTVILDAAQARGAARRYAEVAFEGWISFVRSTALAALVDGRMSRAQCHRLCMDALDATVGAHVDLTLSSSP